MAIYVVSTPIGNLKDITLRALEVLRSADLILCEDARQSLKLLNHYSISKPLVSYFQHSRLTKVDYIIEQLKQDKKIALVTDAGTPGISDPGNKLISEITEKAEETEIIPIPGPSALAAAASISGLPMDRFLFLGFPPTKKKRKRFFEQIVKSKYPVIFYESSHRILKTLNELKSLYTKYNIPNTKIVACRELTKQFESIYRGSADGVIKILESDKNNLKGEFTIIVNGDELFSSSSPFAVARDNE